MQSTAQRSLPTCLKSFSPVRSAALLVYLVKESEVVNGRPGREFMVAADDALLSYVVATAGDGFEVARLDADGARTHAEFCTHRCFMTNSLGHAIATDRLFCKPL
jgi:hypothetical protein